MPTPFNENLRPEALKQILAQVPVIQNACDLDLLLFLHRHPRTLLTSEQIAGFVGYNIKDIAAALDGFIEAGLLGRTTQQSTHAARLFLLLLDGPQGPGLSALLELARTREGRNATLEALNGGRPRRGQTSPSPELRLIKCA